MKCLVYKALVRPNLVMGIPREYFYVAGLFAVISWMATNNMLLGFLAMIVSLPLGNLLARVDPDFMAIIVAKLFRIKPNHQPERKQYPEIFITGFTILTGLVTQSMEIGAFSIVFWTAIYYRLVDQGTEYQA